MDTFNSEIFGKIQMPESFVELMKFPTVDFSKGMLVALWFFKIQILIKQVC